MLRARLLLVVWAMTLFVSGDVDAADQEAKSSLFARDNLIAWCIVPFDAKRRGPEERAAMLKRLGFTKFAYDWRVEHIPTFDDEIKALRKEGIELSAWWFPAGLNAEAQAILAALKRNDVKTQLWITMSDPAPGKKENGEKVSAAVKQLRPIAEAAAAQGCSIALYNHGGWFGQPENQIAIIEELKLPNVGIVYNQHHGHEHLDRFAELLTKMKPHLYALNLNGMDRDGERLGRKILPVAQGELDRELLRVVEESGYRGPIGILGHTQDDAEARLQDNLDGLAWLLKTHSEKDPGALPQPRTPVPAKRAKPTEGARQYDKSVTELVALAQSTGDARRGLEVFRAAKFACLSCHQVGAQGGTIGPTLTNIGKSLTPEQIAEAVLDPKRQVKTEYIAWQLVTDDGRSRQGYKRGDDIHAIDFFDIATQQVTKVAKAEIEEQREVGTLMPDNLAASMTREEQRDIVRFLCELGSTAGLAELLAHAHASSPATFTYDRAPLHPDHWPSWQANVNRDRVYDFYAKEALHFRQQHPRPVLLPAFPGLDGGKLGHWGNQNETTWASDRWNSSDLGTLLSGVLHLPSGPIAKAVCVRIGEYGEMAVCFNPETLCYEALWRDGFVKLSAVRHGFIDGLRPDGQLLDRPPGKRPEKPFVYHGFYRFDKRVVFAYQLGEVEILDSPWVEDGKFMRIVAPASEHPLRGLFRNLTTQWPEIIKVTGKRGTHRPYAVDTIPLPNNNPWKSQVFPGGHAFLSNGDALVCTMQGDVWRVGGLDDKLEHVTWRRVASGLHQALGIVIHNNDPYVLGRDQITHLRDMNDDGEYDFYRCFSNVMLTSPSGHDYTCGLERDPRGRFYTASGKQGLIRISADGKSLEVLATGFRNPDGLGLASDGAVTVPCSEGDWTPSSMICLVKPEASDQRQPPFFGYGGPRNNLPPALPLVYLPRGIDNSSGGQATVPNEQWGLPAGQMLHLSFGTGSHFLLLRDKVAGQDQGAVVPLPGEFRSGAHRGAFNPRDGQLYVSGMTGWGSYTPDSGSFERVRYTGDRLQLPLAWHAHENGLMVRFSQPIDATRLADLDQHFAQAWNYRYSQGYGSPELSTRQRNVVGHDHFPIAGVHAVDTHTLFVEIPDLQPVNVLHLTLQVEASTAQELFATIHQLDAPFTKLPNYRAEKKVIAAHPQTLDLAALSSSAQNPWRAKIDKARTLNVTAGKNLSFEPRTIDAKPGEVIKLVFNNPDAVPHNWVLIKPGALAKVGDLTNKMVADPEAVAKHYVPKTDDVLVYSDIVGPQQSATLFFRLPEKSGRYPFLCTFPGHWMVMNGEVVVK